jgi:branched-chain amino acid aminotransferase
MLVDLFICLIGGYFSLLLSSGLPWLDFSVLLVLTTKVVKNKEGDMDVWIDGTYFRKDEAKISVYDHGLLYGDGLFEGIRVYNGKAFKLEEHIDRLFDGAKAIMLKPPLGAAAIVAQVEECVERSGRRDAYIRLVLTRGVGDLGVNPALCPRPSLIIIVDEIKLYPAECYEKGIPIITAATRRVGPEAWDPRVKSLNYLNNVLAKIEAAQAGCMEAVMLNGQGYVAECTADNIFIVKGGALLTPNPQDSILDGITRRAVMDAAAGLGMEVRGALLTRYDLYTADECFMTGTGAEIMPVTAVDGRAIGDGKPGAWTGRLRRAFGDLVGRVA